MKLGYRIFKNRHNSERRFIYKMHCFIQLRLEHIMHEEPVIVKNFTCPSLQLQRQYLKKNKELKNKYDVLGM